MMLLWLACTKAAPTTAAADSALVPGDSACAQFDAPQSPGRIEDKAITEISGIAASRTHGGVLWIHEDSGRPADVIAIDETGQTLATISMSGIKNLDWEDLAIGPCGDRSCLFVGDIGDNPGERESVSVLRFPEPDPAAGDQDIVPEVFTAVYPDGPHDAEALVVSPDGLPALLTKGDETAVYAFPALDSAAVVTLERLGTVDVVTGRTAGLADMTTAADLSADGSQLAVRTYTRIWVYPVGSSLAELGEREAVASKAEFQGEALSYDAEGRGLWHISEGSRARLYRLECLE